MILCGDAADLQENLDAEIAPGLLFRDGAGKVREDLALASIRRLKGSARDLGAELWPNHDFTHWRRLVHRGWPSLSSATQVPSARSG